MANLPGGGQLMADGSLDFSGGVDSLKVTTIQSPQNPNGLARNELAWLVNATVRDGGILQRTGWQPSGTLFGSQFFFQGKFMYEPTDGVSFPYFIYVVSGHVYKVDPTLINPTPQDLSASFGVFLPATAPHAYFVQAEEFLIIQAGDGVTLPLFWDNNILRQSRGLITNTPPLTINVDLFNVNVLAGTVFPAQSGTNNPLGVPYNAFTAGAIGGTQTVPLLAPYGGNVGDTINYANSGTGTMTLLSITNVPGGFNYNYVNNTIPGGASVPAQFAPGNNNNTGRNFPAFVAPAPGSNISFFSSSTLHNPGVTNTLNFTNNLTFTVTAIRGTQQQEQALISEIPAATAMDYYMGRIWYAQGRFVNGGDIVYGTSGTAQYNFRDAVLKITENPLVLGGDGFAVPGNEGNIRAIFHTANLNTQLGQGPLFIGTRKAIYQLTVPVTRTQWIAANNSNQPLLTVAQLFYGPVNDRSIVKINGDAYYQTLEPAIRSYFLSLRDFEQYANIPVSSNIQRVIDFNDRSLLSFSTGALFQNRVWESQLPSQTPQGTVHSAIAILDFAPISSFGSTEQPTWEGIYQGVPILQMASGDFGGRERLFASIVSQKDSSIQLWEFTDFDRTENGDQRVTWQIEFPAYTWGQEFLLKQLSKFELWIDKLYGTVDFTMEYRPDGEACWQFWHAWKECSARNSCEDLINPVCYPLIPYREGFRQTIIGPEPKSKCNASSGRPMDIGFQFQPRLTITGWCRVRGLMLYAYPRERETFLGVTC